MDRWGLPGIHAPFFQLTSYGHGAGRDGLSFPGEFQCYPCHGRRASHQQELQAPGLKISCILPLEATGGEKLLQVLSLAAGWGDERPGVPPSGTPLSSVCFCCLRIYSGSLTVWRRTLTHLLIQRPALRLPYVCLENGRRGTVPLFPTQGWPA